MTVLSDMPPHLKERLQRELKVGEKLIWVGRPNVYRMTMRALPIWLFFVPWTGFSLFFMSMTRHVEGTSGSRNIMFLFSVLFFLAGVAGLTGPFWARRKAKLTVYAITNRRAMTIEGSSAVTVKSYRPGDFSNPSKRVCSDGSGDLILRTVHYRNSDGDKQTEEEGFFAIEGVWKVEQLIDKLIDGKPTELLGPLAP